MQAVARHAEQGSARAIRLIALLRDRWRYLADPHLIEYWWPGVGPGGDPPEDLDVAGMHTARPWW